MKLHWIVDIDINAENHPDLQKTIRELGHKITGLTVTRDFPTLVSIDGTVPVFHGSFEELNKVKKQINVATYGLGPSILRSHYMSYLPSNWFLNSESIMTTWGRFCVSPSVHMLLAHDHDWFVRPDSGYKTFTGQVIHKTSFKEDIELLNDTSNVKPETIIWIATAKKIDNEYRFWISNKKVVTSSEYSWDKDDVSGEIPSEALELATIVAEYHWQIDRIYVIDIAMCNNHAQIIEFNSFSCSGLYNCDSKTLFKAVSEDIIAEWEED